MAGNPLPGFTDFWKSTGPSIFSGPDEILNELTLNTYSLGPFLAGREMGDMLQGGSFIQDSIQLDGDSDFGPYRPGQVEDFDATNTITNHTAPWRFERGKTSWTDAETDLQGSSAYNSRARFQTFKSIKKAKLQAMKTGVCNGIEARMWAQPDYARMEVEGAGGDGRHFSLPCFGNEFTVAAHNVAADGLYPGWVTLQGIDPSAKPLWDNQRFYYSSGATVNTPGSAPTDLRAALSEARRYGKFQSMPMGAEYSTANGPPSVCFVSNYGHKFYEQTLEAAGDRNRTVGNSDLAFGEITFDGIPLIWVPVLDNAPLYPQTDNTGGYANGVAALGAGTPNLVSEQLAGPRGPRYKFVNTAYVKHFWHRDHFFKMEDPYKLPRQPDVTVTFLDAWGNFFCTSRRRGFVEVAPNADQPLIP